MKRYGFAVIATFGLLTILFSTESVSANCTESDKTPVEIRFGYSLYYGLHHEYFRVSIAKLVKKHVRYDVKIEQYENPHSGKVRKIIENDCLDLFYIIRGAKASDYAFMRTVILFSENLKKQGCVRDDFLIISYIENNDQISENFPAYLNIVGGLKEGVLICDRVQMINEW